MTGLTVPVSRADPGRAARPGPVDTSGVGIAGAVADFGDVMFKVGTAVENDRLDREMQRLQVDLQAGMNDLRLQVEQIGDPDAAEAAWSDGLEALRGQFDQPGANGRPRIDPKNAEQFDLAFDDLGNRHAFSLGKRTLELRNAQHMGNLMAWEHAATRTYAAGDAEMRETVLAEYDAKIDAQIAAGRLDAAQGQSMKLALRETGDKARATYLLGTDPQAYLDADARGEFAGLQADTRAGLGVRAQNDIDRQTEAARKAAERALTAELNDILDVVGKGGVHENEALADSAAAAGIEVTPEVRFAIEMRNSGKVLADMPPAQIRAEARAWRADPKRKGWEMDAVLELEKRADRDEDAYGRDAIGYARAQGRPVPDLPEFDAADPAPFIAALAARSEWAQDDLQAGFTDAPAYFSVAEQERLEKLAGVDADPGQRAALAASMYSTPGVDRQVLEDSGFGAMFGFVGRYLAAGGRPAVATDIFQGEKDAKYGNVIMPPVTDRFDAGYATLTHVFSIFGDSARTEAAVRQAADALYVTRSRATGEVSEIDTDLYQQALHEVMGGTGAPGSGQARGGVATVKGNPVAVPIGLLHRRIEAAVDRVGVNPAIAIPPPATGDNPNYPRALLQDLPPDTGEPATAAPDDKELTARHLSAASPSGQMPLIAGRPIWHSEWRQARIEAVGDDQYRLIWNTDAGAAAVKDKDGRDFIFSLKRLVREMGQ